VARQKPDRLLQTDRVDHLNIGIAQQEDSVLKNGFSHTAIKP
jgi:hypothetical protein